MLWLLVFALLLAAAAAFALVPQGHRRVRVALVLVLPFGFLTVRQALFDTRGWPAPGPPPAGATFVAAQVDEPHAIYLWMVPSHAGARPRAYRLPYSDQLYQQILQAQKATQHGDGVKVEGRRHLRGRHGGTPIPPFLLRRYKLPKPHPPPKLP